MRALTQSSPDRDAPPQEEDDNFDDGGVTKEFEAVGYVSLTRRRSNAHGRTAADVCPWVRMR